MSMLLDGAYCYTGGTAFDPALPCVVLLHGAQNDHSVWALQARYLAHHGYGVLAPDLPGHGRSAGPALRTVEAMADWVLGLLAAAGVSRAALVGHSMGSLVALEAAHRAPGLVSHLALLGATWPMRVSDALLAAALADEQAAIDMVTIWSHSSRAQEPSRAGPGFWVSGMSRRLMQRMAARGEPGLFHLDFTACNDYRNGEVAARSVGCPVLFINGSRDQMTPARAAGLLHGALPHARHASVDAGHQMMAEQPAATLAELVSHLGSGAK